MLMIKHVSDLHIMTRIDHNEPEVHRYVEQISGLPNMIAVDHSKI
jgi:hypothetical protein